MAALWHCKAYLQVQEHAAGIQLQLPRFMRPDVCSRILLRAVFPLPLAHRSVHAVQSKVLRMRLHQVLHVLRVVGIPATPAAALPAEHCGELRAGSQHIQPVFPKDDLACLAVVGEPLWGSLIQDSSVRYCLACFRASPVLDFDELVCSLIKVAIVVRGYS